MTVVAGRSDSNGQSERDGWADYSAIFGAPQPGYSRFKMLTPRAALMFPYRPIAFADRIRIRSLAFDTSARSRYRLKRTSRQGHGPPKEDSAPVMVPDDRPAKV
jgi:hypothetical protein